MRKTKGSELNSILPELVETKRQKFSKKANLANETSFQYGRVPLNWQDPLYDSQLVMFPEYNLPEANKRYRHYYKFNSVLSSCVDAHATFPLSDFQIMCPVEEVREYYQFTADRLELLNIAECALRDIALLGEAVFLGNWDQVNLEWEEWVQYPPEFVDIVTLPGSTRRVFTIKPDPETSRILQENTHAAKVLAENLSKTDSKYYEAALNEEPYDIPDARIMYLANQVDGYSKRGYPLTKRALQDLMYEQEIRTLQHTFVQRHLFPIKIFKLGSEALGWVPSQKHFQQFKKLLIQAAGDPDMSLIYHFGLQVDYVGTKDKIENLLPHFEWTTKRIMQAFFMNEALMNGDTSYAGQTANTRLLMHRFMTKRTMLENTFINKIYLPIARQQQLIDTSISDRRKNVLVKSKRFANNNYLLPTFLWQKQNLLNSQSERQFLMQLYEKDAIPWGVIRDVFGLDQKVLDYYRKEDQATMSNALTREIIDQTVKDDPTLSLKYVLGEDPIEIMKNKLKQQEQQEQAEDMMESGPNTSLDSDMPSFDSSAPIDLGPSMETGEEPSLEEEGSSTGDEGTEELPSEGE
jgi:hypothetical protein